jgi:pimeloyl-ACP methyl ester carboxylesterase
LSNVKSLTLMAPAGIRIKGMPIGDNFIWSVEETVRNLVVDQKLADAMLSREPTEEEADLLIANRYMATRLGWEPRWLNLALESWLHRIKTPTHIIWGDSDRLFPAAYGERWRALITGSKLTIVERCGHLPHVEHPDATAHDIVSFLQSSALNGAAK